MNPRCRALPSPSSIALLALSGCAGVIESSARSTVDPVVVVHGAPDQPGAPGQTGEMDELGVSTDYGVVFLGRGAKSGRVEFTAWFGDGPSREEGLVESMGGGVFATESEIRLPSVALCFDPLPAGTLVVVRGRRGGKPFEIEAELADDPLVSGVLLKPNPELDALTDAELGAGVFLVRPRKPMLLVGLLSGRLELASGQRYFTALGHADLWRLVVHRRNNDRPRRSVYRDDVR